MSGKDSIHFLDCADSLEAGGIMDSADSEARWAGLATPDPTLLGADEYLVVQIHNALTVDLGRRGHFRRHGPDSPRQVCALASY